jgi:hypothetical protein
MIFLTTLLMTTLASCLPLGSKSGLNFQENPLPIEEEVVPDIVTFEYLKRKILAPQCISCHKEMGTEKGLKWWIVDGNFEESDLYVWMKDGEMPPRPEPPSTTRELEIVQRYIEQMKK